MRSLMTIALALFMAAPAAAFDGFESEQYFTPHERTAPSALGLSSIDGRYPRPGHVMVNIPNGAGAPVPINPFSLPRPYALGEAAVPFEVTVVDAKGRATHDVRGATAWDGRSARMSFGY